MTFIESFCLLEIYIFFALEKNLPFFSSQQKCLIKRQVDFFPQKQLFFQARNIDTKRAL